MSQREATATYPVDVESAGVSIGSPSLAASWRAYFVLTKPEITFLVTISALAGFVLGSPEVLDGWRLVFTLVGVALSSAGASVLNHYLERDLDRQMRRTMSRPIPSGRVTPLAARNLGAVLVMAGVGLLCPLTNPLTGVLSVATVLLYLFVYTPLKRRTTWNTLVGTLPGAMPALGGWTAATGTLGMGGWIVFAILLTWQMPHFLSLAWMYRKDYGRADFAMVSVADADGRHTVAQALGFTLALVAVSVVPAMMGLASAAYGAGALLLGIYFLRPVLAFYRSRSTRDARRVLKASIYYIPALVALLVLNRLLFA